MGESTRICPNCRTPNAATSPVCERCGYAFYTTRPSAVPAFEEDEFTFEEVESSPPASAPLAPPPQIPPSPSRRNAPPPRSVARATPPAPTRARGPSRLKFIGTIPKGLSDTELEALRYTTMKQALILIALIFVVGAVTPVILGSLRVSSPNIGIVGVIDYVLILLFFIRSRRVARATAKPISGVERQALSKVWWGAFWLILIPVGGSVGSQFGIYFQTNPMHPIYYLLAGIGILLTLQGVTSLKERHSYYSVFQFGIALLLAHPLPALFPVLGPVFVNSFWFATTFLFLAAGFIGMAFALRKMRAGQYEALERAVAGGQKALDTRQYDKALSQFDRAVTIAHSIYADKLFKSRASGKGIPADYYVPWMGKATALALSGRGSKALAILDLILEVDPGNADLWSNKGDVLLAMNRPAEAYVAFEQAQRINPSQPLVLPKKQRALDLIQRRME